MDHDQNLKTAITFLRKIEQTASQNKWDEANTIIGFEMKLVDAADGWWTSFKEDHPNSCKKWGVVKVKEFLKQYFNEPQAPWEKAYEQNGG